MLILSYFLTYLAHTSQLVTLFCICVTYFSWQDMDASPMAKGYYHLPANAKWVDTLKCIVSHQIASLLYLFLYFYLFSTLSLSLLLSPHIFLSFYPFLFRMSVGFRHFRSLRTLKRDHGWIATLLEEAENERMHLLLCLNKFEAGESYGLEPISRHSSMLYNKQIDRHI